MSKFQIGQRVYLFNSVSMAIESDEIFCVLYAPMSKSESEGSGKSIKEKLDEGLMEVREQYQTTQHGILDVECLFGSEEECKAFFRNFFS